MNEFIITYRHKDSENEHIVKCNSYAEAKCVSQPFLRDDSVEFVQIDVCETLKEIKSEV